MPPVLSLDPGCITTPAEEIGLVQGEDFAFALAEPVPEWNHCHPVYTPVDVYLLATQPTQSSLGLNSTFQFKEYLFYYAEYTINNLPGGLLGMLVG